MTRSTFMLYATGYYVVTMIIIVVVLVVIGNKNKKKYLKLINDLEREKNLIISASILSELNKVEALINNDELRLEYENWNKRFNEIKEKEIPKISDMINDVQSNFEEKDYEQLKLNIVNTEMEINYLKTKSDFLLNEIRMITLSEERNREKITKLKAEYRAIVTEYHENINDYERIKNPIELQFENTDKFFTAFEKAMDKNAYTEVGKIVKAIDGIVANLKAVIKETKVICQYGEILIPKRIEDIRLIAKRMINEGYNIEYLNIDYNIDEAIKKIQNIFQKLNVLDVEDAVFELKTMYDYFDSLYNDFEKERVSKTLFEDYTRDILLKHSKLEKQNNELYKAIDEIKYSFDLNDEDVSIIVEIKDELIDERDSYDKVIALYRNKTLAYSKLSHEMEAINNRLSQTESKLTQTVINLRNLKDDEKRAHDQYNEIKEILFDTKSKVNSYKLPVIPRNFYVELSEASDAINLLVDELSKKPASIKMLNMRVDNAMALVLKAHKTINDTTKTAKMAEMAIVYGNRYRTINHDVDFGLTKAENAFYKGNYKNSLDQAINSIDIVETGIYEKLLNEYQE